MKRSLKKVIAICCIATSILTFSTISINATSKTFTVGSYTATASFTASGSSATASTSVDSGTCSVTVSAIGTYQDPVNPNGVITSSNGNGGYAGTSTSITSGGQGWISLNSYHNASYSHYSNSVSLSNP